MSRQLCFALYTLCFVLCPRCFAEDKVQSAKGKDVAAWMSDYAAARTAARQSNRPMLVVFR